MANTMVRKTFKVQFEISVEMDEVQDELVESRLFSPSAARSAAFLRHLQQALLADDGALLALMRPAIAGKLQEYVDYLAAQDEQPVLLSAAETLPDKDRHFLHLHRDEFDLFASILRSTSLSVYLDGSWIDEKVTTAAGDAAWQEVWRDMLQGSQMGRLLQGMCFPVGQAYSRSGIETDHYLLLRHVTRQVDGVHVEGSCTCDQSFTTTGEDESQALERLWAAYQEHYYKFQLCQ